jgi:hypothetical protein
MEQSASATVLFEEQKLRMKAVALSGMDLPPPQSSPMDVMLLMPG